MFLKHVLKYPKCQVVHKELPHKKVRLQACLYCEKGITKKKTQRQRKRQIALTVMNCGYLFSTVIYKTQSGEGRVSVMPKSDKKSCRFSKWSKITFK